MSSPPEFHLFVLGSFTRINSRVSGQTGRRIGSHQWSVPPWLACGLGLLLITGMWYSCIERLFMWNPWEKNTNLKASSYCVADRWCLWPLICILQECSLHSNLYDLLSNLSKQLIFTMEVACACLSNADLWRMSILVNPAMTSSRC